MNPISIHEDVDLIPGLAQWVGGLALLDLWCRSQTGSDLVLPWLWCSPAAVALTCDLAWELAYAVGATLEKTKKKLFY